MKKSFKTSGPVIQGQPTQLVTTNAGEINKPQQGVNICLEISWQGDPRKPEEYASYESRHEKTRYLSMRKQRLRSASQ